MLVDVGEHWDFFGGLPASTISSEYHIEYYIVQLLLDVG